MSEPIDLKPVLTLPSRRLFLSGAGKATLSSAAVVLLAGCGSLASAAMKEGDMAQDVAILNVALALEHEAIGAYQLGAESGLLQPAVLQTAVLFQSQHKEHRDVLTGAIRAIISAPAAQADHPSQGEALYKAKCAGCHAIEKNRIGPRHRGVFGRRAGSLPDFSYSAALKDSEVIWNAQSLDRWLENPAGGPLGSH